MRKFTSLVVILTTLFFTSFMFGQASLPLNESFSTITSSNIVMPTGFTHSGVAGYTGALKFDTQGDWLQLQFASTPGTLTFDLGVNNTFPGTIPSGVTFTLEESANGTDWTSVTTYSNIAGGTKTISSLLNTTRYLKWTYTTKPSGTNIALKNVTLAAFNANVVVKPVLSVVTGNYISSQSVTITTSTADANIRYTLDGTEPTESSTLYSSAISISTTTTIKAKAFKTGLTSSDVASSILTFPTTITTIANLKAASTTGFYKLTTNALVTYSSTTFGKTTYLQDATGGIMLYDNDSKISTAFNIGDILSDLYCTLKDHNGMLELIPAQAPTLVSSGNTVNAKTATIAELINYPGELVKVNGITVSDISGGTGMFASGKSYPISDGINSTVIRTSYTDLPYLGYLIPTGSLDITGVVLLYTSSGTTTAQLVPRTLTDFSKTLIASTSNPSSKSGIYASEGKVVLTAEAGEVVEVFNAVGQRLVSIKAVSGENRIPVAAKGIVMVRTKGQSTKVVL